MLQKVMKSPNKSIHNQALIQNQQKQTKLTRLHLLCLAVLSQLRASFFISKRNFKKKNNNKLKHS